MFHDVRIKALGQICDIYNSFRAILAQLTSNLSTSTVTGVLNIFYFKTIFGKFRFSSLLWLLLFCTLWGLWIQWVLKLDQWASKICTYFQNLKQWSDFLRTNQPSRNLNISEQNLNSHFSESEHCSDLKNMCVFLEAPLCRPILHSPWPTDSIYN